MTDSTVVQMLLVAISSLAAVIVYLFKTVQSHYRKIDKRLSDCEADRFALWHQIAELRGVSIAEIKHDDTDET